MKKIKTWVESFFGKKKEKSFFHFQKFFCSKNFFLDSEIFHFHFFFSKLTKILLLLFIISIFFQIENMGQILSSSSSSKLLNKLSDYECLLASCFQFLTEEKLRLISTINKKFHHIIKTNKICWKYIPIHLKINKPDSFLFSKQPFSKKLIIHFIDEYHPDEQTHLFNQKLSEDILSVLKKAKYQEQLEELNMNDPSTSPLYTEMMKLSFTHLKLFNHRNYTYSGQFNFYFKHNLFTSCQFTLEKLKLAHYSNKGILDLKGIEVLKNLKEVEINSYQLQNISSLNLLASLTTLEKLTLDLNFPKEIRDELEKYDLTSSFSTSLYTIFPAYQFVHLKSLFLKQYSICLLPCFISKEKGNEKSISLQSLKLYDPINHNLFYEQNIQLFENTLFTGIESLSLCQMDQNKGFHNVPQKFFSYFPNLTELESWNRSFDNEQHLSQSMFHFMPTQVYLKLKKLSIRDSCYRYLWKEFQVFKNLESLRLSGISFLTSETIEDISKLTHLKELSLTNLKGSEIDWFLLITTLSKLKLESFTLRYSKIKDPDKKKLGQIKRKHNHIKYDVSF